MNSSVFTAATPGHEPSPALLFLQEGRSWRQFSVKIATVVFGHGDTFVEAIAEKAEAANAGCDSGARAVILVLWAQKADNHASVIEGVVAKVSPASEGARKFTIHCSQSFD